jgi:DNA (cytosine-5)-methyltransferase 1
VFRVPASTWPVQHPYEDLSGFLEESKLLSARATAGFLRRARSGRLRFAPGFLDTVESHLHRMTDDPVVPEPVRVA